MRYEEFLKQQLNLIKKGGMINVDAMPDMDLYIDQAEGFFRKFLDKLDEGLADKYVTKSMINNYAKKGLIARPNGKKYTREHMVMIAMVIYFRSIFKMEDISKIMKPLIDSYNSEFDDTISPEVIYDIAETVVEKSRSEFFGGLDDSVSVIKRSIEDTDLEDDERMEVLILILTLSIRAGVEKYLASRLMTVYFDEPGKQKQEKFKIQSKPASRDKKDNISEI
ncbi:MAG: DUF1836 domain-containing protein [Anaerovoracaceae bacterium]|nr:DUF1836 domain-containing protein [Bacillota bacterium]MDY2671182.1 DUF1836 domain-containing protein [Anaerovoracaceae bacterium]